MEALSLPLPSSRQVQFANINDEIERQKIQKRSANNVLKKQKKKAKRMAAQTRKEKVRYFLEFLKNTRTSVQLCQEMSTNGSILPVALMFPAPVVRGQPAQPANVVADGQLTSFCDVVASLQLPRGTKRQHEGQMVQLEQLADFWTNQGWYDSDLDPFLQYLRERITIGQSNLTDVVLDILAQPDQAEAERTARVTQGGLLPYGPIGSVPACRLPAALHTSLRDLEAILTQGGAYHYGGFAIQTGSSGDLSDNDEPDVCEI